MFAIVESGNKQYKVEVGDVVEVELLPESSIKKDSVTLETVLLVGDEAKVEIGTPYVKNAIVQVKILEQIKSDKVIVFKKKSKKTYKRTRGHRQNLHQIRIENIEIMAEKPVKAEKVEKAEKDEKVEKVEKALKPEKVKVEKAEKTVKAAKAEKTAKTATAAKTTKAKKAEIEKETE